MLISIAAASSAAPPVWWYSRNVINHEAADENAALNAGQLKHFVSTFVDEMNAKIPGGAGTALNELVTGWRNPSAQVDNYVVVNLGQVKAVTKLIYDRLNEVHDTEGYYPWNGGTADNYAVANLGQLKRLLNLDVNVPPNKDRSGGVVLEASEADPDQDGLPTWFELLIGTDPHDPDSDNDGIPDGEEDHDNDGHSNLAKWMAEAGSGGIDTDGDGLPDEVEAALGTSPILVDTDGDGESDALEVAHGSDPTMAATKSLIGLRVTTPLRW